MSDLQVGAPVDEVSHQRANYLLEHGRWHAICRGCGWSTEDQSRRRASSSFRVLHREVLAVRRAESTVVDLSTLPSSRPDPLAVPTATGRSR